jgi:hypothetical protein
LPTLTGILSVVSIDENNNCKVMIENFAPFEVTIERNNLLGLVEIEEGELIPLRDDTAAEICASIKDNILKTPIAKLSREEIAQCCNLQVPDKFREKYIDILFKHQETINLYKYDLGLPRTTNTNFIAKARVRFTESSSKYQRPITILSSKCWRNG